MTEIPAEIQQYEKKIYDLRQLLEISRALNSTLDYQYLIQAVLDMCLAQVQTLSAALFLTPEMDSDMITLVAGYKGFDLQRPIEDYHISLDSPMLEFFEHSKKAMTVDQLDQKIGDIPSLALVREMGAELIVPVKAKGKVMGLIVLGEKVVGGEYPDSECNFLVDLASLGGVAVDNARLYERATVDMMTSLKNHAYFQSRFREERERALRRKLPLALLLTDVDKFKNFNDTHGHQAGDEVLKAVARVLIDSARSVDTPARYGGEEFCVLMPGADADRAMEMAEKIRSSVQGMTVVHEGKEMKVTLSIGVSVLDPDEDQRTNKNMIERSDKALYACKHGGRNQVQFYQKGM
ncbi:MAG: sensor domain-containing diguanylate cyclase [Leptospiraceae bacterium]|nr:sensor domain-containing diguanylate cyclase [Leptospiraceae bacterium]